VADKKGKMFSRREFVKNSGVLIGGSAIASLINPVSCKTSQLTTSTQETQRITPAVSTSQTTTSPTVVTTSTTSSMTTSTPPPTSATPPQSSSSPPASNQFVPFQPQKTMPALLPTPGCQSMVAKDRLYSKDHIWVKSITDTICVLGITDKFQLLISNPKYITLPRIGDKLTKDAAFGDIEGMKLSSDLISPVSGTAVDVNSSLLTLASQIIALQPIIESPYISGWLVEVQITKPEELKSLMSPEQYVVFTAELH
jgi:glycine cleavage system H protein